MPRLTISYFAALREQRGLAEERIDSSAASLEDLYKELQAKYELSLPITAIRFALNDEFAASTMSIKDGDSVAFIPPVAGG